MPFEIFNGNRVTDNIRRAKTTVKLELVEFMVHLIHMPKHVCVGITWRGCVTKVLECDPAMRTDACVS